MHEINLYNTLLSLSRNIFFYKNINLKDSFETRIYLMFIHFSIFLIIHKKKGKKFDQISYDKLFYNIEYNLRESGFGDVAVNKKMKDLNKILYDILLKIEKPKINGAFGINFILVTKYLNELNDEKSDNYKEFNEYFLNFYDFCFANSLENMVNDSLKFKY